MPLASKFNFYGLSITGPRLENEDSYDVELYQNSLIASVADGVGGRKCGAIASKLACETFKNEAKINSDTNDIVSKIQNKIVNFSKTTESCVGLASTFSGCYINDRIVTVIHVGDSRICILRGNGIRQITYEHTEGFRLLKKGLLTQEQYLNYPRKHVIESAFGIENDFMFQTLSFKINYGDRILISTDGFHNIFSKQELRDFSLSNNLENLYSVLKNEINNRKLVDNTTFVIIEVL